MVTVFIVLFSINGRCRHNFTKPIFGSLTLFPSILTEPCWLFVEYEA